MALSPLIEKFIKTEDLIALKPSLNPIQVEAALEDVFAYIRSICPGVCKSDWTDMSTVRSVLRSASIRRVANSDGLEQISQSQGENSQTLRFNSPSTGNFVLLLDEKEMILSACRAYAEKQDTVKKRLKAAEASRLTRSSGDWDDDFSGAPFYRVTPLPGIGVVRESAALPFDEEW